jgi:hypothetical protein
MIWLRNNCAALRSNNINVVYKSNSQKVLVHHRTLEGNPGVVVALNFSTYDQTLYLEFPWAGTWYEFTRDDTLTIESNWYGGYTIPAASARIFTSEHLWLGLDSRTSLPQEYALYPAFPNPFNPSTTFRYGLPEATYVTLKLYDIRGREVWSFTPEPLLQQAGSYSVTWSGVNHQQEPVAAGVYYVELRTTDFRQVRKVTLIK